MNTRTILVGAAVALAAYLYVKSETKNIVTGAVDSVTPTNPDNIFAGGVDSVGEILTGDNNFRLGGWVYDKFNNKQRVW